MSTPVFDVPRLDGIAIDGKADDWGALGMCVNVMTDRKGYALTIADLDAAFRLGWNDMGLLVLVEVRDDKAVEAAGGDLWSRDGVEMFVAATRASRQYYQVVFAPGREAEHPELRTLPLDKRQDRPQDLVVQSARTRSENGYTLEVLLPWKNLGVTPRVGLEPAFQLYVNDADSPDGAGGYQVIWYPYNQAHHDPNAMYPIRLAQKAGPPVTAVATGYEHDGKVEVTVLAERELARRTVAICDAATGRSLARGRLKVEKGGRVVARFELPSPMTEWNALIGKDTLPVVKQTGDPHFAAF